MFRSVSRPRTSSPASARVTTMLRPCTSEITRRCSLAHLRPDDWNELLNCRDIVRPTFKLYGREQLGGRAENFASGLRKLRDCFEGLGVYRLRTSTSICHGGRRI
jgi:hypothetical protein